MATGRHVAVGQRSNHAGASSLGPLQCGGDVSGDLGRRSVLERRVLAQAIAHGGGIVFAEDLGAERGVLVVQAGELGPADLVHGRRGQCRRGRRLQQRGVGDVATGQVAQPRVVVVAGHRQQIVAQDVAQPAEGGTDGAGDGVEHIRPPRRRLRARELDRRRLGRQRVAGHRRVEDGVERRHRFGDTSGRRHPSDGSAFTEARHPPVDERRQVAQLGDVAPPVLDGHEGVGGHEGGEEGDEVERPGHQGEIACVRQQGDLGAGAEGDGAEHGRLPVVAAGAVDGVGPAGELAQRRRPLGHARGAEILPVLDLVDVAAVDVPQLGRRPVEVPELVRHRADLGHVASLRDGARRLAHQASRPRRTPDDLAARRPRPKKSRAPQCGAVSSENRLFERSESAPKRRRIERRTHR